MNLTLAFGILNGALAINSLFYGNWIWFLLCGGCSGYCFYNYKNQQ